jgi:signal transduction histidine kinase
MKALTAALFTAPGRPPEGAEPSRGRAVRILVALQASLAVVCALSLYRAPWLSPLLTLLAATTPVTLAALGRPLVAWRFALLGSLVVPWALWLGEADVLTRYLPILPAIYVGLVANAYGQRIVRGAWLATSVVAPATTILIMDTNDVSMLVAALILPALAAALGRSIRGRRLATRALAEEELRSAKEQAARAVLEERSRIARELHDVVAHHMSVIAIHAETAPYRVAQPPAALAESFSVIRSSAVEAMAELRRMLALLRSPDGASETVPQPGLHEVQDLVQKARASGLEVDLRIHGPARPLPSGLELSAYRIVQEGLSNVLRHAPGASASIEVAYAPDMLRLAIVNSPPATAPAAVHDRPAGPAHGLLGMRERVAMLGGVLVARPTPDGGFLVRADLPLDPDHATP